MNVIMGGYVGKWYCAQTGLTKARTNTAKDRGEKRENDGWMFGIHGLHWGNFSSLCRL